MVVIVVVVEGVVVVVIEGMVEVVVVVVESRGSGSGSGTGGGVMRVSTNERRGERQRHVTLPSTCHDGRVGGAGIVRCVNTRL